MWFRGVAVITLACHARDRGFNSRRNRQFGFIAQLAEHKTENLGVVGSIPTEATILLNEANAKTKYLSDSDGNLNALIAQLDRAFDYGSKGYGFDSYWAHH